MSFTHAVRKALSRLRYPTVDADGNLVANVALRTGTLDSLLAISNAGDGEVAVATDKDALVVYQGDPSVGVVYSRNHIINECIVTPSFLSVATATTSNLILSNLFDPQSVRSGSTLVLPSELPRKSGNDVAFAFDINLTTTAGHVAGTEILVMPQWQKTSDSSWTDVAPQGVIGTVASDGVGRVNGVLYVPDASIDLTDLAAFRFQISHDAAGSVNVLGQSIAFRAYEG